MDIQALRQQIGRWLVIGVLAQRKDFARCASRGFLGGNQMTHHVHSLWDAIDFLDQREVDIFLKRPGGGKAQRPDALAISSSAVHCSVYCCMNI
jgi:hypothetical protein